MAIAIGTRTTWQRRVEPDMTADHWGNTGVMVLATPHMVGLLEATSVRAIVDQLEPGQSTVGTHIDLRHLKATAVGETVTLSAEVIALDGRRVTFRVKAEDSGGVAGEGTHERVLIDLKRFLERVGATS
ncbi:MAG: thioesterase family protein [Chloroflexi bacterium]|nr:thioesterase family protein [Chloroflexota bacterium]